MQRTQVISGGFRLADANGWVAKVIYPGCSVIFVTELDWPWLSCVRTFRAAVPRLTEWSCEGGQRWGRGRSIGTNFRPNVTVGSDGKLIGATPCHPTAASHAFLVSTRPLAKPTIRPLSSASLLERSALSDPRMVGTGALAEPALITSAESPQSSGSALHLRARSASCRGVVHDTLVKAERGLERPYREDAARLWRALVAFSGDREVAGTIPGGASASRTPAQAAVAAARTSETRSSAAR
jgi:hypothetical protein